MIEAMDKVEMIDVVDENGNVIDTMSREKTEHLNHLIQNVIVFVFNSKGEVWIQKRPMSKKHFPGLWDVSACGAVGSGEKPEIAALRETKEEMGFSPELKFVESFLNVFPGRDGQTYRRLSHLYIGRSEEIPKTNEEVDDFKAVPRAELREQVVKEPDNYIPSFLVELDKATTAFKELSKK